MSQIAPTTTLQLPVDLVQALEASARTMGLDLTTYLVYLQQVQLGHLDHKAQDAARFMMSKHDASLRKLAQ